MRNLEDIFALAPAQTDRVAGAADPGALGSQVALLEADLRFAGDGPGTGAGVDSWNRSWARVIERHPALRTLVLWQDAEAPLQVVRQRVEAAWRLVAPGDPAATPDRVAAAERAAPLEPARAPLARGTLVVTGDRAVRLLLAYHPLALDRESVAAAISELLRIQAAADAGREPELPPSRPFRDYVAWLAERDREPARAFWGERLARGAGGPPEGRAGAGAAPGRHRVDLPPALGEELAALARRAGAPVEAVAALAWALLLARGGGARPRIGVELTGPLGGWSPGATVLGAFARLLPVHPRLDPRAEIAGALGELAREIEDAERHALLPLAEIGGEPALDGAVTGPPPAIEAPAGVEVAGVRWWPAAGGAAVTLDLPAARPAHLDLWLDPERAEPTRAEELGAGLAAQLAALAAGGELGPLLGRGRARVAGPGLDPAVIGSLLARHRAVRGARVVAEPDGNGGETLVAYVQPAEAAAERPIQFSLFYFADADSRADGAKYRLYLDNARYADRRGFTAVWTPERHFHENGGLYPNPSVLSAALATVTERIGLRAGSVVLPLHHTLRVAEEWAVVDNLSGGRVGLSFASGWVPNDFAFFPERFADKREHMFRQIGELQRLWRGEKLPARDGKGNDYEVGVFPRPVQPELPIWITCSGDPAVFERTAELRHNVLTALLTMPLEEAAEKIALYRARLAELSGGAERGHVTMMIHTYVGEDEESTRRLVRPALSGFLSSHLGLVKSAKKSLRSEVAADVAANEEHLVSFAFERYYRAASLLGGPDKCAAMVERLRAAGVDELACLIDFGLDADTVLDGVRRLAELKEHFDARAGGSGRGPEAAELQSFLAARLPEAAVPSAIRLVDVLPEPRPAAVGVE